MKKRRILTREEQETVIRASAADQDWNIWTCDPRFIRYLKRQGYESQVDYQSRDAVSYRIPFRKLRIARKELRRSSRQLATLAWKRPECPEKSGSAAIKNRKTMSDMDRARLVQFGLEKSGEKRLINE